MNTSSLHDSSTTNSLLGLANSGDEQAFAQLFARHEDALRQLIKHRIEAGLARRFDASDVVQETRVTAFQRLGDFVKRRPMPLAIWLQRTALQQLADLRRYHVDTAKRSLRREQDGLNRSSMLLGQSLMASKVTPSAIVSAEEEARRVRAAVAELDEADREILMMRYVEQFSNREIAYLLDVTDAVASKRHGMALMRLRQTLKRLFPES